MSSACLAHAGNQACEPRRRETRARGPARRRAPYARYRDASRTCSGHEPRLREQPQTENRKEAEGMAGGNAEGTERNEGKAAAAAAHDIS